MRKGSIAASLFWLSAGWLIVALVATGFLLTDLYSRALDTSLSETLDFHVESLAGALLEAGDPLSDQIVLTDPRFGRPRSGWYWAIRDDDGVLYNLSTSVVGIDLPVMMGPADAQGRRTAIMDDAFGTSMRVVEREVTLAPRPMKSSSPAISARFLSWLAISGGKPSSCLAPWASCWPS